MSVSQKPRISSPALGGYLRVLGFGWVNLMATGVSVGLTLVLFFLEAVWRTAFLCGAVLALLYASYRAWAKERDSVITLETEVGRWRDDNDPVQHAINRLTGDAKELLIEASQDPRGEIVRAPGDMNRISVSTCGREFVENGDAQSEERWYGAARDLENLGIVRPQTTMRLRVTGVGYRVARELKAG